MLGNGIKSIGPGTFAYMKNLKSIYISNELVSIHCNGSGGTPFSGCSKDLKIYSEANKAKSGWKEYWNYNGSVYLDVTYGVSRAEYEQIISNK